MQTPCFPSKKGWKCSYDNIIVDKNFKIGKKKVSSLKRKACACAGENWFAFVSITITQRSHSAWAQFILKCSCSTLNNKCPLEPLLCPLCFLHINYFSELFVWHMQQWRALCMWIWSRENGMAGVSRFHWCCSVMIAALIIALAFWRIKMLWKYKL